MTYPVVTVPPYSVVVPPTGLASRFSRYEVVRRQAKPYNLDLVYSAYHLIRLSGDRSASSNFDSQYTPWFIQNQTADLYQATNEAYMAVARSRAAIKFNNQKGAQASLGVALAEAKESMKMITTRLSQLVRFGNALRKFRFYDAAKALGLVKNKRPKRLLLKGKKLRWTKHPIEGKYYPRPIDDPSRKRRIRARVVSGLWLEYAFGWAPLAQDIYTAMEVLDEPLQYQTPIRAVGGYDTTYVRTGSVLKPGSATTKMVYRCLASGVVTVKNPNKDLLRRMGLVNPALIAFELVPFSFVLGWFTNIDSYLRSWTEYYGVEVSQAFYTEYAVGRTDYEWYPGTPGVQRGSHSAHSVRRSVGSLPNVKFGLKPAYALLFRRAITQSSLLVQLFIRPGKRWR